MSRRLRRVTIVTAATSVALLAAAGLALATPWSSQNDWPYAQTGGHDAQTFTLAAVGDIACEPDTPENSATPPSLKCGSADLGGLPAEYATAQQAYQMKPDAVALLGDEQYEVGKLSDFEQSFEQAWGGLRLLERPAPGNHEYYAYKKHGDNEPAQNGTGYFGYFNGHLQDGTPNAAGQAGADTASRQGWYSYDLGHWHVISLNVECNSAPFNNDCSTTDNGLLAEETQWLAADLKADDANCTVAYWHQPTFSATTSATDAPDPSAPGAGGQEGGVADAWWKLLYQAHATLILNGHEHVYARFRPMNPAGQYDPRHGITQLTIGTGGEDLDTLATTGSGYSNPNVVTGQDQAFGVMNLQLKPNGYTFSYQPTLPGPGADSSALNYRDAGSGSCRS
jgi:acid phosphatase type 7